jgi:hypothetical protein
MNNATATESIVNHLTAAAIATIRETATRLGTQDPEEIREKLCPAMSPEHWATLLAGAGVLV